MITTTSTRSVQSSTAHLLLGVALAGGLSMGLAATPAAHAAAQPGRLSLTAPGMHGDPGCPSCSRMRPNLGCTDRCGGPGDPVPWIHHLDTTSTRTHPDPGCGTSCWPFGGHMDARARVHPAPYHTACNLRACDPAVARPSLLVRAKALRLIFKWDGQGTHPLLNPQPLPPRDDDVLQAA